MKKFVRKNNIIEAEELQNGFFEWHDYAPGICEATCMMDKEEMVKFFEELPETGLKPLSNHIVVKVDAVQDETEGGLLLPESAKEKPTRGMVIEVGIGLHGVPMHTKPGDIVYYGKFGGKEVKIKGIEYTIIRETDVFMVVYGE